MRQGKYLHVLFVHLEQALFCPEREKECDKTNYFISYPVVLEERSNFITTLQ